MFAYHIFDKELLFSTHKTSQSLTVRKQPFFKKMGKRFEQTLHIVCVTSSVMREMQTKTIMRYHHATILTAQEEEKLTTPQGLTRTRSNWNSHALLMAKQHGTS